MATITPRIGEGPGFDSQDSVTLFSKHCFPNLHWIHGNIEVEDCEFVPVIHQRKWNFFALYNKGYIFYFHADGNGWLP